MNYRLRDLREYINAMSLAEKRYFLTYCREGKSEHEDPYYLRVFSGLAFGSFELPKQEKKMSEQALTSAKRKIFERIKEAMLYFHRNRSEEMMIRNMVGQVEIFFYNHNLPHQSYEILRKAIAIARRSERFDLLLSCLLWERKLCVALNSPVRSLIDIRAEEDSIYGSLMQISQLESLLAAARKMKQEHGYVSDRIKSDLKNSTISSALMPPLDQCTSAKSQFYYNFIHALFYWMVRDHANSYRFTKTLLSRDLQQVMPNDYLDGILEHVTSSFCLAKFEEALTSLEIARLYADKYKLTGVLNYRIKLEAYLNVYGLMIYNFMGNVGKLEETILSSWQQINGNGLPTESSQVLLGNLMHAYIGVDDPENAIQIWNRLFRKRSNVRRDVYHSLYLFRLFFLLQKKDYETLAGFATSAYRYYRKTRNSETGFELELQVCLFLKKDWDLSIPGTLESVLIELDRLLLTYIGSIKGTDNFQEHYTFYRLWLECIHRDVKFQLVARQWYLKRKQFPNLESI